MPRCPKCPALMKNANKPQKTGVDDQTYSEQISQRVPGETGVKIADLNQSPVVASSGYSRRNFLGRVVGAAGVTLAGSPLISGKNGEAGGVDIAPETALQRRNEAYEIRHQAAVAEKNESLAPHPDNGDDALFANKIGSYSKGLSHNVLGEVNLNAYRELLAALAGGDPGRFEAIPLGGSVKLTNPQAGYAFELEGADPHRIGIPAPPAFSSAWEASEMVEVYWQALTRDVAFINYSNDPLIAQAAIDLSAMSDFRGPKSGGAVTQDTLFRGNTPGDLTGPYISQFLWKDIPYGATTIVQRYRTTIRGDDHMTSYAEWLNTQNGMPAASGNMFDSTPRYVRNGRDLGEYVHRDLTYQTFLDACCILLSFGPAALDTANPYLTSKTQSGFATFGPPHILDLVARAANAALKAAWYQKWLVHRRLRPEVFGGRIHNRVTGAASYPIHADVLNSNALVQVHNKFGTFLLPQAYPEGSPTHPSYPAGHPSISGACATMLKWFFNESFVIPNPVQASADGLSLLPLPGPPLTIGGELNKAAANVGIGRDTAGVHWRSDGMEGLKLGEAVAINILADFRATFNEDFAGCSLTKFDGTNVIV